jgi:hypothetical protein
MMAGGARALSCRMLNDPIPALKRAAGAQLAVLVAGWNADDIAYLLGTDRSRIAELRRGKLYRFSLERLIRFLTRAGQIVELRVTEPVRPSRKPRRGSLDAAHGGAGATASKDRPH